ncbi:MAG: hypothetical protein IPL60_12165 [Ardenticatenia bacterium]|nr:hypothetical protein [Ardenticatenia bacterium]
MIAGPVAETVDIIGHMVADMGQKRASAQRAYTDAIQSLKDFQPSGLTKMRNWVEPLQIAARDQAYEYVRTEQMYVLLRLTQELLGVVGDRLQLWKSVFDEVFSTLAISDPSRPGDGSGAIGVVGREYLERLEGRLRRLATFRSARISCLPSSETDPDTSMQGFRDVLRDLAVKGDGGTEVGEQRAALAEWQVNVVDGQPRCILRLDGKEFELRDLAGLHRHLFAEFSTQADNRLRDVDIFDFVKYLQSQVVGFQLSDLTNILRQESSVLISAAVEEEAVLVTSRPQSPDAQALSNAIAADLRGTYDRFQTIHEYSDRHSIYLIRLHFQAWDQYYDIQTCKREYERIQGQNLSGNTLEDSSLYRAQVHHVFPHELEAWYIERWFLTQHEGRVELTPRVVRLLEDPAMTQAFIRCLAVGSVVRNENGLWRFRYAPGESELPDAHLTEYRHPETFEDLLRAAEVMCLSQRDCRPNVHLSILRESAVASFEACMHNGASLAEWMVGDKVSTAKVDAYLDEYFAQPTHMDPHHRERYVSERKSLEVLFRFYLHPMTKVGLRHRVELLPLYVPRSDDPS